MLSNCFRKLLGITLIIAFCISVWFVPSTVLHSKAEGLISDIGEAITGAVDDVISDVTGEEIEEAPPFEYETTIDTDTLDQAIKLTKYNGNDSELVIPGTIDGLNVIEIGDSLFESNKTIKSVDIPDSIKTIGSSAFMNCESLKTVTFGNNSQLNEIGLYAFKGCKKLVSLDIPDSVQFIWGQAFRECTNLIELRLPSNLKRMGSSIISGTKVTSITIPKYVYDATGSLTPESGDYNYDENKIPTLSITFENGIKTIPHDICGGCYIESITIPESVTTIESSAFISCHRFKSIYIPKSVTTIEESAFHYDYDLKIYGYTNSEAEKYSRIPLIQSFGIEFIPINKPEEYPYSILTIQNSPQEKNWKELINNHTIKGEDFNAFSGSITSSSVIPGLEKTHLIDYNGNDVVCENMVPQGICVANSYTLISAYCWDQHHSSVLYVLKNGKYLETIVLTKTNGEPFINHVGGITFLDDVIYIAGSSSKCVYQVKLSTIINGLGKQDARKVSVNKAFDTEKTASFICDFDRKLYVGTFYQDKDGHPTDNSTLLAYDPNNGGAHEISNEITLPRNTAQGISFIRKTDGVYMIVSASHGRDKKSELFSIKWNGEKNIGKKQIYRSIDLPSMSEDLCISGNTLYVAFESAAKPYLSGNAIGPLDRIISINPDVLTSTSTKNGLLQTPNGSWALYKNGAIDTSANGIYQNSNGWWRVEKGFVDFKANGIYQNSNGWWKTTNGKVTFKETGVFQNEYGWWRVKDSKVDFSANGIYQNGNGWWKTTDGKVTFKENGVFQNENGWWKVKDSKVDFSFTGIASNKNGSWYIKDGKVDFKKNGKVKFNNKTYTINNGKVV